MLTEQQIIRAEQLIDSNADSIDPEIISKMEGYAKVVARSRSELAAQQEAKPKNSGRYGSDLAQAVGQGVSFGFADELQGAGAAIGSLFDSSQTMSEAYTETRDKVRDTNEAFRQSNPKAAFAAEMIGGIGSGIGAAGLKLAKVGAQKAASAGSTALKASKIGAVEGAVYGAGSSESDNLGGLAIDTAVGGTLGGAFGAVIGGVSGRLSQGRATRSDKKVAKLVKDVTPKIDSIKKEASSFYDSLYRSDAALTEGAYKTMVSELERKLKIKGFAEDLHGEVANTLKIMKSRLATNEFKFSNIETLRRSFSGISGRVGGSSDVQNMAGFAAKHIDDFIGNVKAKSIVGSTDEFGGSAGVAKGLKEARDKWRLSTKAKLINDVFFKAQGETVTTNGIAAGMTALHKSLTSKNLGKFTKAEEALILKASKGGIEESKGVVSKVFGSIGSAQIPVLSPAFKWASDLEKRNLTLAAATKLKNSVLLGKNPENVVRKYIKDTAKANRSPEALAEAIKNVSLDELIKMKTKFKEDTIQKAIDIAIRSAASGAAIGQQAQQTLSGR